MKVLNASLLVASLLLLTFEARLLLTRAQGGDLPGSAPAAEEAAAPVAGGAAAQEDLQEEQLLCRQRLAPFMEKRRLDFGVFINDHFRSALPTSELIPIAIERLREYRDDVRDELLLFSVQGGRLAAAAAAENGPCQELVDQDFDVMKELLRQHILQNAFAKKSTRLLDKYKEINDQLADLNLDLAQMYGNFGSLSQRLPCYATQCTTK